VYATGGRDSEQAQNDREQKNLGAAGVRDIEVLAREPAADVADMRRRPLLVTPIAEIPGYTQSRAAPPPGILRCPGGAGRVFGVVRLTLN
jgi:hypothetical protein